MQNAPAIPNRNNPNSYLIPTSASASEPGEPALSVVEGNCSPLSNTTPLSTTVEERRFQRRVSVKNMDWASAPVRTPIRSRTGFAKAIAGELRITTRFPEGTVEITQFEAVKKAAAGDK